MTNPNKWITCLHLWHICTINFVILTYTSFSQCIIMKIVTNSNAFVTFMTKMFAFVTQVTNRYECVVKSFVKLNVWQIRTRYKSERICHTCDKYVRTCYICDKYICHTCDKYALTSLVRVCHMYDKFYRICYTCLIYVRICHKSKKIWYLPIYKDAIAIWDACKE